MGITTRLYQIPGTGTHTLRDPNAADVNVTGWAHWDVVLFLGLLVASSLLTPVAAEAQAPKVAVLPIKFFDTSAEPQDQLSEHKRRTASLTAAIAAAFDNKGLFQTVTISPEMVRQNCRKRL